MIPVIVTMIDTEPEEREYYTSALAPATVHFVCEGEPIDEEVEIISTFISTTVDQAFLQRFPRLRLITTRSRAVDHINLPACRERGVSVCHAPESGETSVAEHTFALILALARRLREFMLFAQQPHDFSYEDSRAFDLYGKTLGIIGMGKIGRRVCELARAFGMKVVGTDVVEISPEQAAQHGFLRLPLEDLLAQSDVISLHVNLSPQTQHLLNRRTLALCKRGALIINTARGRLIETEALRAALQSGHLGGAGLDVLENESVMRQPASMVMTEQILARLHASHTEPEQMQQRGRLRDLQKIMASDALLALPNVVFTPHVAFNSIETVERIAQLTVQNIRAFCEGQPVNLV